MNVVSLAHSRYEQFLCTIKDDYDMDIVYPTIIYWNYGMLSHQ